MIPLKAHPKWRQLVSGEIQPNFSIISGNMILNRLSRSLKRDNSEEQMQKCINEAYEFFSKFDGVYGEELNRVFN